MNQAFLERQKIKHYTGQPVRLIQKKADGHWTEVYKDQGVIHVFGKKRVVNMWPKLEAHPTIGPALRKLPDFSMFAGELYCPGVHATSVPTMINDCAPELQLMPFVVRNWSYDAAVAWSWESMERAVRSIGLEPPPNEYVANGLGGLSNDEIERLKQRAIDTKVEGYVLKGSHSSDWYKLKPTWTVDAAVSSTTVSDSDQHFGGLKAIQVSLYSMVLHKWLEIASVGSGFEASYRAVVDRDSLINRVAEVEYEGVAANGRLKFPRFLRWRDDKPFDECTLDQLPDSRYG